MAIDFWTGPHSGTENLSGHNLVTDDFCVGNRPPALGYRLKPCERKLLKAQNKYCYESVRAWPPILKNTATHFWVGLAHEIFSRHNLASGW
jgi:hypothetical protein